METSCEKHIALIGNPNCGKTTIFNLLTGSQQVVGNWHGVTVEKKEGYLDIGARHIKLIDLPGVYALDDADSEGLDEKIALNFLQNGKVDLIINVLDAAHLQRSLYLTLQLLALNKPVLLVLNMCDIAEANNIAIDKNLLAEILQAPLVSIAATQKNALAVLKPAINAACILKNRPPLHNIFSDYENGEEARLACVSKLANKVTLLPRTKTKLAIKQRLEKHIDALVLHRFLGLPILGIIMYLVFAFSIICGGALGNLCAEFANMLFTELPLAMLHKYNFDWPFIKTLLQAIGGGIAMVAQFVPAIAALYFALGVLEDSGYMMRAAFLLDNSLRKIGLSGKAFIPLVLGFGCNVPAIMATRALESQRDRITTIMMLPFMSCSARLATYTLFVSAFFPKDGHLILFALYLTGIIFALLTGILLRRYILKGEAIPFMAPMPSYNWPNFANIYRRAKYRLKQFILKAGSLIIMAFIIFQLIAANLQSAEFAPAWRAKATSFFEPIGITQDNWPAVAGIFAGVIAKEMVIGTLGAMYLSENDSEKELATALQQKFGSKRAALAYLVFILLYFPCVSVFAAIMRELNWRWAVISVSWSSIVAYLAAMFCYQVCG